MSKTCIFSISVFGLGTLIFTGLEIAMHATMEKNCVENILIAHPILQALFTFLQMHFLFVNSQVSFYLSIFDCELDSINFFWLRAWLDSAVLKEACSSGPDLNSIQSLFTFLQMHFLFVNSQASFLTPRLTWCKL